MKNFKKQLLIAFALIVTGTYAQENVDVLKETVKKTYEVDNGDKKVTYVVTINTSETQSVELQKGDEDKINQERTIDKPTETSNIEVSKEVSKSVTVNNYYPDKKEIDLSYVKAPDEELRFVSTPEGLAIISSNNTLHRISSEGTYVVYSGEDMEKIVVLKEFETIK